MKQQASESREGRFYCADEFYLTCRTQTFNNKDNFITTIYSICVCVCVCTHCVLKLLKYGESVLGYMSDVLLLSFFRLNVHTSFLVFAFLFRICLNVFRPLKKKRKENYILKFVQNRQKRKVRTTNINRFTKCVFYCVFHRIVSFCLSATNESYHFRPLCLYFCTISNFFFCAGTSVKNTPPRFRRPRARLPRRFHLVRKIQDRRRRRR